MDVLDLTATPVLQEIIDAKDDEKDKCVQRDILIVKVEGRKFIVVTEWIKDRLKTFYNVNGKHHCNTMPLDSYPWNLGLLGGGKIVASLPEAKQIVIISINVELTLLSKIRTEKDYWGLDVLDESSLVAGAGRQPSVDILDMEGRVRRTLTQLPEPLNSFVNPWYIHVTRQGTILVSDPYKPAVICMNQLGGVVFIYTPTREGELVSPRGLTTTSTGEIIVADAFPHRVIYLSESGEFIKEILTEENDIWYPKGVFVDGKELIVANESKGIFVFNFVK